MRILTTLLIFMAAPLVHGMNLDAVVAPIKSRLCSGLLSARPLILVVGLGNFGYQRTRHNIGDEVVRRLADFNRAQKQEAPEHWLTYRATDEADAERYMQFTAASSPRRNGLEVEYRVGGRIALLPEKSRFANIVFVNPYYDINESGHFVSALVNELGLQPQQVVVLVDDITLARNQIVMSVGKPAGDKDGHNGLKSINSQLGTGSYYRIRIGISNPKAEKLNVTRTDWVLGQIPEADLATMFSKDRLGDFMDLLENIQARQIPGAHHGKLVNDASTILKRMNSSQQTEPGDVSIPWNELSNVAQVDGIRRPFFTAQWRGRPVFIKRQGVFSADSILNEADFAVVLNGHGIGPKFLGMTRVDEKNIALVYEDLGPGVTFRMDVPDSLPPKMKVTEQTIEDVVRTYRVLTELKIAPNDGQFLFTPEGRAVLIDFEGYEYSKDPALGEENARDRDRLLQQLHQNR